MIYPRFAANFQAKAAANGLSPPTRAETNEWWGCRVYKIKHYWGKIYDPAFSGGTFSDEAIECYVQLLANIAESGVGRSAVIEEFSDADFVLNRFGLRMRIRFGKSYRVVFLNCHSML